MNKFSQINNFVSPLSDDHNSKSSLSKIPVRFCIRFLIVHKFLVLTLCYNRDMIPCLSTQIKDVWDQIQIGESKLALLSKNNVNFYQID